MSAANLANPFGDVTVRFVGRPPSEEVVYFARRCAKERWLLGPITVVVEITGGAHDREHEVRIEGLGDQRATDRGPDVLLAVRNAFDRFELCETGWSASADER